jgi:hypothetical protein
VIAVKDVTENLSLKRTVVCNQHSVSPELKSAVYKRMVYGTVDSTIGNTDHLRTRVLRVPVSTDFLQVCLAPGLEIEE